MAFEVTNPLVCKFYQVVNPMPRTIIIIITVALLFYLGLCVYVFAFQRLLIYFPQSRVRQHHGNNHDVCR
jgi:hypothetical protein